MNNNMFYDYYCSSDSCSNNDGFDSSHVDCTLSLGTPSTRSEAGGGSVRKQSSRRSGSRVSNVCWDLLQQTTSSSSNHSAGQNLNGEFSPAAMRCANCDTGSTPLWRKGPNGPKSLCNACGIRYKKEERRRAASATADGSGSSTIESSQHYYSNQHYY